MVCWLDGVLLTLVFDGVYPSRSKLERDKDRDISEKIALGLPATAPSQETLFDQRLFNQSKVSYIITFLKPPLSMFLWAGDLVIV